MLKLYWVESGWNKFRKLFTTQWWADAFSTVVGAIEGLPGLIKNAITSLFSWSTWENIFRSLWNSTLGGATLGKGKFSFTIPRWGGGSTWTTEGAGTKSETLVTTDADTGKVLSYEAVGKSGLIESAYKSGIDKEGNVLEEKYGVDNKRTGKVLLGIFEWMKRTPEGEAERTMAGYKTYRDDWKANRTKDRKKDMDDSIVDRLKEAPGELKKMFDEFGLLMKGAALAVGTSATVVAALKIKNLVSGAVGKVMQGGLAPGKVAIGIVRLIAQQINPFSQEAFIGQIARGVPKGKALGKAMGEWKGNMLKDLGIKQRIVPDIAQDLGSGSRPPSTRVTPSGSAGQKGLHQKLFPLADPDVVPEQQVSRLAKARKLVEEFTSWVLRQLRNIGGVIKNAQAVKRVGDTAARMLQSIEDVLRPVLNQVGAAAPDIAEAQRLLAVARVSKSFLLRATPLVGAALGIAETAYNIHQIAGSDLSWVKPKESEALTRDIERMKKSLGMSEALLAESASYGYGPGDWFGVKKWMTSEAAMDTATAGAMQGAGVPLMHTKSGAILTQLLLGTATTGAGALGVAGLPFSLPAAMAQEMHRMGVMGDDNNMIQGLIDAFRQGLSTKDKGLKIQIDGMDAVMDIPGY